MYLKMFQPNFFFWFQIVLADVPGTGKEGRILKEDIMHYLEEIKTKTISGTFFQLFLQVNFEKNSFSFYSTLLLNIFCNVFTAPPPTVEAPTAAPTVPPTPIRRPEVMLEDRTQSIKGIRKAMVKAMTASLAVPHFGYKDEIILNELVRYGIFDTGFLPVILSFVFPGLQYL